MSISSTSRSLTSPAWVQQAKQRFDRPLTVYYVLIGCSSILLAFGLMMVLSASSVYSYRQFEQDSYHVFVRQVVWVLLGLGAAFVASRFPQRWLRILSWPAVAGAIVLLILVQTPLGATVNGNRNWLRLGPVQIQPSEVAKLAIILWTATVLSKKEKLLDQTRHILLPVVPAVFVITVLVMVGQDLGTALVLIGILLGMLWVAGLPGRWFLMALGIAGVGVLWIAATSEKRLARLTTFMDPFQNFRETGWQAGNGLLGMSNGGLLGRGLSASQQKWGNLPEAHTDFIFAVIGEEWGLFGTLLVLFLFSALLWACFRLAMTTADTFVRYLAAGVGVWLLVQMMINIGMVLAVMPVIGLPLPLVSYGGSALVPMLVALGLLINFARNEPEARLALENRRRARKGSASSGDSVAVLKPWRGRFGR